MCRACLAFPALVAVCVWASLSLAQAPLGWLDRAFPFPGMNGAVVDTLVWDDGSGPALYACGGFSIAGETQVFGVARWNGSDWTPMDEGLAGANAIAVFDDGSGETLFAAGRFTGSGPLAGLNVAKWDGHGWLPVGQALHGIVQAMAVFDDGFGPALFAGGDVNGAIVRLEGDQWVSVAGGMSGSGRPTVHALECFDDGMGKGLYVGGNFNRAGSVFAENLARWDGARWSAVGTAASGQGTGGTVLSLRAVDLGSSELLYVGGQFATAGSVTARSIVQWDGTRWLPLAEGVIGAVGTMAAMDLGGGQQLFVGGRFRSAGSVEAFGVARWDGDEWHAVGQGTGTDQQVNTLTVFDSGDGEELFAGGAFTITNGARGSRLMKWDGQAWSSLYSGLSGPVLAMLSVDEPDGRVLIVGGDFFAVEANLDPYPRYLARWDGNAWSPLGEAFNGPVHALALHDAGNGPELYAGGAFTMIGDMPASNIARWDGQRWWPLAEGLSGGSSPTVSALISHDDGSGPALYAGGGFFRAGGTPEGDGIARWDGERWSALGERKGSGGGRILGMAIFDEGEGPMLFACGSFDYFGGVSARRIGRWDGASWSAVGEPINFSAPRISALEVHDDGSGPALYAGGDFRTFGDTTALRIAKWDGQAWSALGEGFDRPVNALRSFDHGDGPQLYAGGEFSQSAGEPMQHIGRWDGSAWSAMDAGLDAVANAMVIHETGSGEVLVVAGNFTTAGSTVSNRLAVWTGPPPPPCPADLDGDGELTIFDFLTFQNLFDAGDPRADFDGDGELTIFDFLAFQNAFDAGCQ